MPDHIQDLWNDHNDKLTKIRYTYPEEPDHILPQFYANYLKKVHLAAVFGIPIDEMHRSHYEERLHAWAVNLIQHFSTPGTTRHGLKMSIHRQWTNLKSEIMR